MFRQTHVDHAATGATGQGHIPKNSCASAVFSTSRRWDNLGRTKGSPNQKKCWWHYLSIKNCTLPHKMRIFTCFSMFNEYLEGLGCLGTLKNWSQNFIQAEDAFAESSLTFGDFCPPEYPISSHAHDGNPALYLQYHKTKWSLETQPCPISCVRQPTGSLFWADVTVPQLSPNKGSNG